MRTVFITLAATAGVLASGAVAADGLQHAKRPLKEATQAIQLADGLQHAKRPLRTDGLQHAKRPLIALA